MKSIIFNAGGYEMLRLCDNGEIYVKTKLAHRNKQVVQGLKEWLTDANKSYGGSIVIAETIASNEVKITDDE